MKKPKLQKQALQGSVIFVDISLCFTFSLLVLFYSVKMNSIEVLVIVNHPPLTYVFPLGLKIDTMTPLKNVVPFKISFESNSLKYYCT